MRTRRRAARQRLRQERRKKPCIIRAEGAEVRNQFSRSAKMCTRGRDDYSSLYQKFTDVADRLVSGDYLSGRRRAAATAAAAAAP